jgi:hypothetical protein
MLPEGIMNVLYLGTQLNDNLTRLLEKAGHRIIHARYRKGILGSSTYDAVVVQWKSRRDQRKIEEAKRAGAAVLVITSKLLSAYRADEQLGDLYLEEPATDEEVAELLIDLIGARPKQEWRAAA